MVPCPYYIPDDFVLIQFDYNAVSTNIQNGDTVTISGSEVYEVITGSYDTNDQSKNQGYSILCEDSLMGDYSLNNLTTAVDATPDAAEFCIISRICNF